MCGWSYKNHHRNPPISRREMGTPRRSLDQSVGTFAACRTTTLASLLAAINAEATSPTVFFTSDATLPYSSRRLFNSAWWFSAANRLDRPAMISNLLRLSAVEASSPLAMVITVRRGLEECTSCHSIRERASLVVLSKLAESDVGTAYRCQRIWSAV